MKPRTYLAVAFLVAVPWALAANSTSGSGVSTLPECAQICLEAAIANSSCNANDSRCTCTTASIEEQSSVCIATSCTVTEALFTQNATKTACGVPVRDRTQQFITVTIVLGTLSGLVVLLRLGSKLAMKVEYTMDDWSVLVLLLCGIPSSVMNVIGTAGHGEGRDIWTLSPDEITTFGYYFYVLEVVYFAQVSLLKTSLLAFYLRIFPGEARKLLLATVVFNVLYGIAFVFLAAFQCTPVSFFWTGWDGEHVGRCLNINSIGWANAAISIALDVWMLAIPLWQIRNLKLHWKKKVGVAMMFFVGTFVTVVSIIRLQFLVDLGSSTNPTFDQTDVSIWSTVEINVGIICTCMPSLRLFLVRLFPVLGGSSHNTRGYENYGDYGSKSKAIRSKTGTFVEARNRPTTPDHGGIELQMMYEVRYDKRETGEGVRGGAGELGHKGAVGSTGDIPP
ncbi:putative PTH11-type G-protein coupled receptor protein [Thozetella sp. PMI_491]|nr:putative PTH11-type G-protein coupled receptor protein [Thozetella sp. PMI_491]